MKKELTISEVARMGGLAVARKMTKEQRKERGRKGGLKASANRKIKLSTGTVASK